MLTAAQHPSWMLVRLELETRCHTGNADSDRLVLLDDPSPTRYRQYLSRTLGFEESFEDKLARMQDLDPVIERLRGMTGKLRADLRALGMTDPQIDHLPRCSIPLLKSAPQALGWIYVLERNSLVHGLIRRHLAPRLPREHSVATTYLATHDGKTGTRYRELGVVLDNVARVSPYAPGAIVSAAHEAFRIQRQWYALFAKRDTPLAS
jgi:heme oxygenase